MNRLALLGLLVVCSVAAAQEGDSPTAGYDAEFVDIKVPEEVKAGEVFSAQITMRNTGSKPWESWPLRLRTVGPENNTRWGTSYIIVQQGTTVEDGQEYTFQSNLRAPEEPGEMAFQWQMCRDGKHFFGQKTAEKTIRVVPHDETAEPEKSPAEKTSLTCEDFVYVGSFKPPAHVGKSRGAFSNCGLAFRRTKQGKPRLIINYTHTSQVLYEVDIPELVNVQEATHEELPETEPAIIWGTVRAERDGMQAISPNGDFAWDDETGTLYWTWYHGYKTGAAPPVFAASKLQPDGKVTTSGPWLLSVPSGLYKGYWGGVVLLPDAWAREHTDGKRIGLGFGGYYSICGPASRGPALGVIPQPKPEDTKIPVTELLYSPYASPAPRDGEYFSANCGFWYNTPTNRKSGKWTFTDHCTAGVFIDDETKPAYIVFTRMGTGRLGYDFGKITSAGQSAWWYVYDAADLAAVADGKTKATDLAPSSMTPMRYPLGKVVSGACYDKTERMLYLCVVNAYRQGRERFPVIHAYRLRDEKEPQKEPDSEPSDSPGT